MSLVEATEDKEASADTFDLHTNHSLDEHLLFKDNNGKNTIKINLPE